MSDYKVFRCIQCGFEYDEALGWPEDGIAPGTRWNEIPEDWSCPDCAVREKLDFESMRPMTMRGGTARGGVGQSKEVRK